MRAGAGSGAPPEEHGYARPPPFGPAARGPRHGTYAGYQS